VEAELRQRTEELEVANRELAVTNARGGCSPRCTPRPGTR
jgi:hypothetical protein